MELALSHQARELTMTYVQYPSGSGIQYPLSGELIGQAADFLRLKTGLERLKEGPSYKTAQRYFRGERVEPGNVRIILDELVAALVPSALVPSDLLPAGLDARAWLRESIEELAGHWDWLVAEMNGQSFPILHREDVPVPFLRPRGGTTWRRCAARIGWRTSSLLSRPPPAGRATCS